MNYRLIYNLLIQKSIDRTEIPDVIEKHHIVPKSMGGNNAKENIVLLTPREHYIAHHLLWKIHRNRSMHFAFWLLATKCSNRATAGSYNVSGRTYQLLKEQHSLEVSKVHKGKTRSVESRLKSSISLKGKSCWCKGKTGIHSEEGLKNIGKANKDKKDSVETKKKRSESAKMRPMPENIHSAKAIQKRKISNQEWRDDNQITCPHCNLTGVKYNMERYHFDNCKIINPDRIIESKSKGITLTKHKCPHCYIKTSMGNLKRWHFDNCKKREI